MAENKLNIIDESGDRGYFTIIPNYILNHSTAVAQALYLQLKRLAGEDGIAYPGSRYLRDKLGISQPTLRKEFKYLLEKGWIKYDGEKEVETDGGKQKIKSYKIVNLWNINNTFYKAKRGEKIDTPSQRGEKIDTQGVKTRGEKIGTKEEPSKEEPSFNKIGLPKTATDRKSTSFLKSDYERVIKKYEELKGVQFNGNEYLPIQQAIKSMFISKRSADDIIRCMKWFSEKAKSGDRKYIWTENWTIKTIKIKIAEFLAGKLESGSDEELIIPSYAKDWIK